ncbi:membrane protein insertase YidC [Maricurvus nonylphenolicus]|uniref:membrane protein insertase YidC n=1 Tax=Maricurvus nonylphenolicus TaxID=1008307 RepID=UPI0036F3295D
MDWQRTALLGAIAAVTILLFGEWSDFQERNRPQVDTSTTLATTTTPAVPAESTATASGNDLPSAPEEDNEPQEAEVSASAQLIAVKTDTLDVLINTEGGDIVKVALPQHLAELGNPEPFILLNQNSAQTYVARSGLIGPNGTDTSAGRPVFSSSETSYQLADSEDKLVVELNLDQGDVKITKRFTFTRGDNLINVDYLIDNQSSESWKGNLFAQIKRDAHQPIVKGGAVGVNPFLGAALTTTEEKYKKLDFEDMDEGSFKTSIQGGWVAMVQHYFLSAWVPEQSQNNTFNIYKNSQGLYLMGFTGPRVEVASGQQGELKSAFYAGPKDVYRLEEIAPYLDLTVDYGWLWWIAKPLFYVLHWIHGFLGSWGWSIIALTIIIKAAFFQLSATSYRSMANMRRVQPQMQSLKERYGDDRQKMSQELMKLYKTEKINPLGGCLPILVQMPVFIALYWVLLESVELRHTPFLGWIEDLSIKDPFFILPIIMGATMWIQQKLNPTPPDPTQARIMQMMPFVFTFMFMWFPAGLVLYWVVNNTLSIAQQYVITKQIESGAK